KGQGNGHQGQLHGPHEQDLRQEGQEHQREPRAERLLLGQGVRRQVRQRRPCERPGPPWARTPSGAGQAGAISIRLRPAFLARYRAWSAHTINCEKSDRPAVANAIPPLSVSRPAPAAQSGSSEATAARRRSATEAASSTPVSSRITANSSPP